MKLSFILLPLFISQHSFAMESKVICSENTSFSGNTIQTTTKAVNNLNIKIKTAIEKFQFTEVSAPSFTSSENFGTVACVTVSKK